jgi:hypothetical protein
MHQGNKKTFFVEMVLFNQVRRSQEDAVAGPKLKPTNATIGFNAATRV